VRVNLRKVHLLTMCLLLFGCSNEQSARDKFFNETLSCPSPALGEFEGWGESGTQHICKIKHGPFIAWENGYVNIRGQYENGKEVGEWLWYDVKGNVQVRGQYENGKEVGEWFWYDASGTVVKKINHSKTQPGK